MDMRNEVHLQRHAIQPFRGRKSDKAATQVDLEATQAVTRRQTLCAYTSTRYLRAVKIRNTVERGGLGLGERGTGKSALMGMETSSYKMEGLLEVEEEMIARYEFYLMALT
jgi:hypothetical protein